MTLVTNPWPKHLHFSTIWDLWQTGSDKKIVSVKLLWPRGLSRQPIKFSFHQQPKARSHFHVIVELFLCGKKKNPAYYFLFTSTRACYVTSSPTYVALIWTANQSSWLIPLQCKKSFTMRGETSINPRNDSQNWPFWTDRILSSQRSIPLQGPSNDSSSHECTSHNIALHLVTNTFQAITWHQMTWPPHQMTWHNTSHNQSQYLATSPHRNLLHHH